MSILAVHQPRKRSKFARSVFRAFRRLARTSEDVRVLTFAVCELAWRDPNRLKVVVAPFLAANWTLRERVLRVLDHLKVVHTFGGSLNVPCGLAVDLLTLNEIDSRYRITVDRANWFLNEGLLVLNLWDEIDRIFSIAFCLSSRGVAYVGGIQGRCDPHALDRYRQFTKLAGMRPREFLIEVLKLVCVEIDIYEIRAVTDRNHYTRHRPSSRCASQIKLPYNLIWGERGGVYHPSGFYIISTKPSRRERDSIPSRKRAHYHRRYAMLDAIQKRISSALARDNRRSKNS